MTNKKLDEMNNDELRTSLKELLSMIEQYMEAKKVAEIAVMLLAKKLGEEPLQLMRDAKRLSEDDATLISELGLTFVPEDEE